MPPPYVNPLPRLSNMKFAVDVPLLPTSFTPASSPVRACGKMNKLKSDSGPRSAVSNGDVFVVRLPGRAGESSPTRTCNCTRSFVKPLSRLRRFASAALLEGEATPAHRRGPVRAPNRAAWCRVARVRAAATARRTATARPVATSERSPAASRWRRARATRSGRRRTLSKSRRVDRRANRLFATSRRVARPCRVTAPAFADCP